MRKRGGDGLADLDVEDIDALTAAGKSIREWIVNTPLPQRLMDDITTAYWLVLTPLAALFGTLLMVVFIGEAVREAFDPKVFSRLR